MNRYYNSIWGRFLSPDPSWSSANPGNPQSWNRYAYVLGDPISRRDRSGLGGGDTCNPYDDICLANEDPGSGGGDDSADDGSGDSGGDNSGDDNSGGNSGGADSGHVTNISFPYVPPVDLLPASFFSPLLGAGFWMGGSGGGRSGPADLRKSSDPECQTDVINAMKTAWSKTGDGASATGAEAGFALVGSANNYTIDVLHFTNEYHQITFNLPAGSFAIFHVHGYGTDPWPDTADQGLANRKNLVVFSEGGGGLWEYTPHTKGHGVELAPGLGWMKPCPKKP